MLLTSRTLSGLIAGLFFAYAVSVMPALRSMDDATFVSVLNRINVVIVNPVFLVVFLGAPAATVALLVWDRSPWAIAGRGAGRRDPGSSPSSSTSRSTTRWPTAAPAPPSRTPWVLWNVVRTLTGTAALVCLLRV